MSKATGFVAVSLNLPSHGLMYREKYVRWLLFQTGFLDRFFGYVTQCFSYWAKHALKTPFFSLVTVIQLPDMLQNLKSVTD